VVRLAAPSYWKRLAGGPQPERVGRLGGRANKFSLQLATLVGQHITTPAFDRLGSDAVLATDLNDTTLDLLQWVLALNHLGGKLKKSHGRHGSKYSLRSLMVQ